MKVDFLLRGGYVIDGKDPYSGCIRQDLAISGERIINTGNLNDVEAENVIDIEGLYVSPGFIDTHAHSEFTLLADGRAETKISQGVTTEVIGNCGLSAAPLYGDALTQREEELKELEIKERWSTFREYFQLLLAKGISINIATLVGHNNLRASVAGYTDRPLSSEEKERMLDLLHDALRSGAKGLSTGLVYPPGIFSDTQEIIDLARETASCGGIYTTHMRSEGDKLIESIEEVITIAKEAGIHTHISHLKTLKRKNWGKLNRMIELLNKTLSEGLKISCDRYPYTASSTDLDVILPSWVFEGGHRAELINIQTKKDDLIRYLKENVPENEWKDILISSVKGAKNRWMEGKSIAEICRIIGGDPAEFVLNLLLEEDLMVGAIFFYMSEENLREILKLPYLTIGSDSSARSFDGITAKGKPHPRCTGSFPRFLGRYIRECGLIPLSEAIYRITGLAAEIFNISKRGVISKGYYADLVVFDPAVIIDRSTYDEPFIKPDGIYHVFVNGRPVMINGRITKERPGRIV